MVNFFIYCKFPGFAKECLITFFRSLSIIRTIRVNVGEPAVVIVFPIKIKVVEEIRPESTAAGSLFGWSLGEFVGERSLVICHWSLGERFKERSLVISHWSLVKIVEERSLNLCSTLGPRPQAQGSRP